MRSLSSHFDSHLGRRLAQLASCGFVLLTLGACAKQPATGVAGSTRVLVTLTVDGRLRAGSRPEDAGIPYIYIVAMNVATVDNPTTLGPTPVISPPWGNGFVAGDVSHFVWWDPTAVNPYTVYRFVDTTLNNYIPIGIPVNGQITGSNSQTLQFEIDVDQLETALPTGQSARSLQLNLLTMDRFGSTQGSKQWDALGDGNTAQVNLPITIPLRSSGTYSNSLSGAIEPRGDTPNPDLDIVDWKVEVRVQ